METIPTIYIRDYINDLSLNPHIEEYSLIIPGILATITDAAANLIIKADGFASVLRADLKRAAIGNPIIVRVYQSDILWASINIPVAVTSVVIDTASLAALVNGSIWRVDILGVGGIYPGNTLVVTIVV